MIVFFMGLPGAGKTTLSKAVANSLGMHRFEIDHVKRELYPFIEPDFQYKLDNNIPLSYEVHKKLYEKAAEDLTKLAGIYTHVVIDEMLHKGSLCQRLFNVATAHFNGYMTIWIKPSDAFIRSRLVNGKRDGHLLKDPIGTYEIFKEKFEDPVDVDLVVTNEGTIEEAMAEIVPLIRLRLSL